jgi:hypothetical protein
LIVRAHEVVPDGFQFPFEPDMSVVTVFSATNADDSRNRACYMTVNEDETLTFMPLPEPQKKRPRVRRSSSSLVKHRTEEWEPQFDGRESGRTSRARSARDEPRKRGRY